MEIEKALEEEILVLYLSGDFDAQETECFAAAISDGIDSGHRNILVDLEEVSFVDSTAIKEIVHAEHVVRESDGTLVMVRPRAMVERVLKLLELERKIPIFENPSEARSHLRGP